MADYMSDYSMMCYTTSFACLYYDYPRPLMGNLKIRVANELLCTHKKIKFPAVNKTDNHNNPTIIPATRLSMTNFL